MARHVGLKCGVPVGVPALTVNRLCGSGFQAIANGAQVNHFFNSFYAGYFFILLVSSADFFQIFFLQRVPLGTLSDCQTI